MANLVNFIDDCLGIATSKGLSPTTPIVITITSPDSGERAKVVCAYTEPHDLVLPFNVTWIDSDPASADYKDAFKRTSKDPVGQMQNTWEQILAFEDIFTPAQFYDGNDLPLVEAKDAEIATALDHINENVLAGDPHRARFYTDIRVGSVEASLQEAVNKNNLNYQLILELQTAKDELTDRVIALETGSSAALNSIVHYEEEAAETWLIEHNFNTNDVLCQIYDSQNDPILPSRMQPFDENAWLIFFDIPISGKAILVGV